jgi:hypothetical protein
VALAAVLLGAVGLLWVGHAVSLLDDMVAALLASSAALFVAAFPILKPVPIDDGLAPLIALVGCDGSGKTTLSGDLLASLAVDGRVATCYLGLGSGALGEKLKAVPIVGRAVERKLATKAGQARTKGQKIPGAATAIVVYAFSLARLRRFRRMLRQRRDGVVMITDRYPQIEIPGFYDGPGLSAARPGSRFVAMLARNERRIYAWMASYHPAVVIRLNVDLETAYARKPDHKYDLLRQKVDATAKLCFSGARIVDLDSRLPYDVVRADAERIVRRTLHWKPAAIAA